MSRCRITQVTVPKFRLKLGLQQNHPSFPLLRDRNKSVHKRLWFSTKNKNKGSTACGGTKKEGTPSAANSPNGPTFPPTGTSLTSHLPPILRSILSPNNPTMTRPLLLSTSPALFFGHAAFLLTGAAYLTKDILHLRLLASTGLSASMVFQYYRPEPLRVPLRWNALFLAINVVMASALYMDRSEAEGMEGEMLDIYNVGAFESRGFRKVDFYRLFRLGKKEVRRRGEFLKEKGEKAHQLCYIVNGTGIIARDRSYLGKVGENDFVGEIEFMRLMAAGIKAPSGNNDATEPLITDRTDDDEASNSSLVANESIVVESDDVTVYTWEFDELKPFLDSHVLVSNALLAYISHELREKLAHSWDAKVEDDREKKEMEQLAVDYLMGGIQK